MTLDQIKTFLWVARLGGFRRAAQKLNLSQPAISSRIAALEAELQVSLFDRDAKGLALTRRGALLVTYAEQILFVQEEIKRSVADTAEMGGLFRIGASETVAQSWLPAFLKAFSEAYPRINVDLTVDISSALREELLGRRLDLAFLMGPVSEFSVENVALPRFHLHWYKAADMGEVDFNTIPVITFSAKTRPHRELTAELSRRVGPNVRVFSSASLSASLQMIAEGIAVGPYPRSLARALLGAGRIVEFDPGMHASPLEFTASYLGQPYSFLPESSARLAAEVAHRWHTAQE
jgi:DNA-binding transcriptional LysR family regulator